MDLILRTPNIDEARRVLRGPDRRSSVHNVTQSPGGINELASEKSAAPTQALPEALDITALAAQEQEVVEHLRQVEEAGRRAYDEGYETGLRTGDADGRDAYTSGLRQLEELTQNLNGTTYRSLEISEDMMVSIVFDSVCKIVGDTLVTKEGVCAVVKEALTRIRGNSALIIRVNPLDLELIEESAAFGVASETDWRTDESISMGGCVIESEYGTLDARIDTQLNQLKRTLLAARHKPADTGKGD
jgi:flagellar assembly protein FliH